MGSTELKAKAKTQESGSRKKPKKIFEFLGSL